jgi:hypothetical protein
MTAVLRTYQGEDKIADKLVEISDDHNFADGPYGDTVPFAVGSNQAILPEDEGFYFFET